MNINDYKDGNGNVEVSENLVSDLIGGINGVVESGGNSNGNWIKFADGTMICTATIPSAIGASASGALFISPANFWNYPQAFVGSAPVVSVFISRMISGGANPVSVSRANTPENGLTQINSLFVWYSAASPTAQVELSLTAIGRWK